MWRTVSLLLVILNAGFVVLERIADRRERVAGRLVHR
jgi:hypothetical protein